MKQPHIVTRDDLNDYIPTFLVASSYPKRLEGYVEIWSKLVDNPHDKSRVKYQVYFDDNLVFNSFDIDQALEYYNNL